MEQYTHDFITRDAADAMSVLGGDLVMIYSAFVHGHVSLWDGLRVP
jgi:hypothetical protein